MSGRRQKRRAQFCVFKVKNERAVCYLAEEFEFERVCLSLQFKAIITSDGVCVCVVNGDKEGILKERGTFPSVFAQSVIFCHPLPLYALSLALTLFKRPNIIRLSLGVWRKA